VVWTLTLSNYNKLCITWKRIVWVFQKSKQKGSVIITDKSYGQFIKHDYMNWSNLLKINFEWPYLTATSIEWAKFGMRKLLNRIHVWAKFHENPRESGFFVDLVWNYITGLAIDFILFTVEFVPFAIEFIGFATEFPQLTY